MTTRIDHTNCRHIVENTSKAAARKARQVCRDARRAGVAKAQEAYRAVDRDELDIYEYYAIVELLSYQLGVSLEETYQIVEEGPIVY